MPATTAQIEASAHIGAPCTTVFAHWMDPEARKRYEAPAGSGMRYKNFSQKQGGVEVVEIVHDGTVIGEMTQRLVVLNAPYLIISQITGTFNGVTSMAMQVTMRFEEKDGGTGIHATSQVVDGSGRDIKAEHEAGWAQLFSKFAADFEAYGQGR